MLRSATLSLSLLVAACGGAPQAPQAPHDPAPATEPADPTCPMTIAGTSVTVEDTATGAALVFVTTSDVGELRKRVAAVATMHNEHHGKMGALPDGTEAGGADHAHHHHGGHGGGEATGDHAGHGGGGHVPGGQPAAMQLGTMIGVHSKAAATEIDGGARLELIAGAADVAKLQGELRMHAQHLASGTCTMSHH